MRANERVDDKRFLAIPYEKLVCFPEHSGETICRFLGQNYDANMLSFYRSQDARSTATQSVLWRNLTCPVDSTRVGRYVDRLSRDALEIFESVACHSLWKLGYIDVLPERLSFSSDQVEIFGRENRQAKELFETTCDQDDLKRRRYQAELLNDVKYRKRTLVRSE